jgi:CRP/FNR family transcriptional regulator, cyclic AMP receptor protein
MKTVNFPRGTVLLVHGDTNREYFFIVRRGKLAVKSDRDFQEVVLTTFLPGQSFGLVSAYTDGKVLGTVSAVEDSEVLIVPIAGITAFFSAHRDLFIKLVMRYAIELRSLSKSIFEKVGYAVQDIPENLMHQAKVCLEKGEKSLAGRLIHSLKDWKARDPDAFGTELITFIEENESLEFSEIAQPTSGAVLNLKKGENIFIEGEKGSDFYIMKTGIVKIWCQHKQDEITLALLSEPSIFGEMAVLEDKARMANATVLSDESEIICFSEESLQQNIGGALLEKILQSLSLRIWKTHKMLAALEHNGVFMKFMSYLYSLVEYNAIQSGEDIEKMDMYEIPFSVQDICNLLNLDPSLPDIIEFLSDTKVNETGFSIKSEPFKNYFSRAKTRHKS